MFPIHLNFFGKFESFYEGIYFAIAVAVAMVVAIRLSKKSGLDRDSFMLLLMIALVSGVIGGNIFQQLFYKEASSFGEVIADWESGFSITGAVIIGPFLTYLYCKWQKYNYWKLFALVVPAIILGQGLGRVGCFMNGDGHGTATELPWAVQFPRYGTEVPSFELLENNRYQSDAWKYSVREGLVEGTEMKSAPVHPSQLYEFLADLALFAILLWLLKRVEVKDWSYKLVPLVYVGGYAIIRFLVEFTRADRELSEGQSISDMQWLLLIALAGSLVWMFKVRPRKA